MRRLVGLAVSIVALAGAAGTGLVAVDRATGTASGEPSVLASLISRVLSTPTTQVHIGGVDGALSSDATIRDVVISDRDGPWLRLDRARLVWRRTALFLRRLEVDELEIGHLEVLRRPLPSQKPATKDAEAPLLPELPVKVEVKRFALADLDLGAPILGTPLRAGATGDLVLGSPSEGLVFDLDGKRLDSPGSLAAALSYVPAGKTLKAKVALDEPSKGLISKLAHLPGEPPVTFTLAGEGTLDAFDAKLDFRAGPTIDAAGAITLKRGEGERRLAVRVGGHLGDMLPAAAAPVFEGATDLASDARIGDDGGLVLDGLSLTSHLARLDAHGTLGADKAMAFQAAVRSVPNTGEVATLHGAAIRKLVFDADVTGTPTAPRIRAGLALVDARLPQGALGRLDARFTATPSGAITDAATHVALDGSAIADGIAPRDAGLAAAIGGRAELTLRGNLDRRGTVTFDTLAAHTPTVTASFAGDIGPDRAHGRAIAKAADLARFGALAGRPLAGTASLGLDLDGAPRDGAYSIGLVAALRDLSTGIAAVDGLSGRKVDAKGHIIAQDGGWTLDGLSLDGAHVAAQFAGRVAPDAAKFDAHVALPDLAKADARVAGAAALDAHITGSIARPDLALTASVDRASAMGRPIAHLGLVATLRDPRGRAETEIKLDGSVDGKPARGRIEAARRGDGWNLSDLDLAVGSVALRGAGGIDARGLAQGSLKLAAGNLDDLSPLALTRLGGTLALSVDASAADGRQHATLAGRGGNLRAGPAAIAAFDVRAAADDVYGHTVIDADARLERGLVAGQAISSAALTAKGSAASSAIKLTARAAGFDLDTAGALVPAARTRFDLASFSARRGARKIALAGPATFTLADGGVDIAHLALSVAGGKFSVSGHAGARLDLALDARAIPLAAADIAVPGLGLSGTFDADARLGGTPADPTGPYHVAVRHLVVPQAKEAGVPPIDIAAAGRLERRRASLDAKVSAGRAGAVTAAGSLPLDTSGVIDLAVHGRLDAAVANAKLGPDGRSVTGSVLVDAKLTGTRAAPLASGSATMSGGTFRDVLLGVRLDAIDARVVAKGDHLTVERLSAATPANGTLSGSGEVRLDPAAGFPGRVALRGRDALLAASSLMTATANLDMSVTGALARAPRVAGRVDLTRVVVGIPDRLPSSLKPIEGITHVNAPQVVAARLAADRKKQRAAAGTRGRPALFEAGLDVTVSAPIGVFVRGRGVDAELGGALHVAGTTTKPVPNGAFALKHGTISALGKTLTFTKGNLTFTGDLVPELDFAAQIQATDITAQVAVSGPASAPVFAFTSIPDLPQDEILSRVLFQKPAGNLSGFQALQLAQAAAQFSGDGDGAFETARKSLGIGAAPGPGEDGPMAKLSRALGDRVSVGVVTGATADQTGLSADVNVTDHVRVQSDVRSNGATSVGVGTEIEY